MRSMIKRAAIMTGLLIVPAGYMAAYETLKYILPPILYLGGAIATVTLFLGAIYIWIVGFWMVKTRVSELNARQMMAAAEAANAQVLVIKAPKDHQLVVRDPDQRSNYRQLHLAPQSHVNGLAVAPTPAEIKVYEAYHSSGKATEPLMIEAPAEDTIAEIPLMPALQYADNILIVGGKGSGKTSLLQHLELARTAKEEIIVMDSHAAPAQWQSKMIGFGRDYQAILSEMKSSLREMDTRYKRRTRGDTSYNVTTSIIDEFTLLPDTLKELYDFDIKTYSRPLLTEGRKVKMNCIWGIHSDRVAALGMKGAGDLKECFDVVVYLKNVKGHRYAICDFGEGKEDTRYAHPGPFVINQRNRSVSRPNPTPEEKNILRNWWAMKDRAFTGTELHRAIRPDLDSRPSANQLEKYRLVIKKYGFEPGF